MRSRPTSRRPTRAPWCRWNKFSAPQNPKQQSNRSAGKAAGRFLYSVKPARPFYRFFYKKPKPLAAFSVYTGESTTQKGAVKMKKKPWLVLLFCLAVLCAVWFACCGRRPYKDLQPSDIVSATVRLSPPDETVPVTDIPELTGYLRQIVIYRRDSSHTSYAGQAAVFTLTMADGSRAEIVAYNPFVILNGTGYRAQYAPCEELNRYANRLLEETG